MLNTILCIALYFCFNVCPAKMLCRFKTVDKVWLWDDYPNKWQRQDLGTDLVFRDNEGLIWAVQAKYYGEHLTTTKGDMNSFLADTGRREVDRRLWLQSTNKIEAKAEKTLKGRLHEKYPQYFLQLVS